MIKSFTSLIGPLRGFYRIPTNRLLCTTTTTTNVPNQSIEILNPEPANQLKAADEPDKLFSRLEIELRGIDPAVMKSYAWFATTAAEHLGIEVGKNWAERKSEKERLTLLRSAFVHKKHRVQYEIRTYFRFMHFHKLTGSTMDTFLEYIERNLPEGVWLKATKVELQKIPQHLLEKPNE